MYPEPDWNGEHKELSELKAGATTLKQCGWCEYNGGGMYRGYCMINGVCDLLPRHNKDVHWDTSCKIVVMGKADIEDIVDSKTREMKEYEGIIKRRVEQIEKLHLMEFDDKPPDPDRRRHDHFNVGDDVKVLLDGKWKDGTVIYGYRHHDGCVSFHLHDGICICGGGNWPADDKPLEVHKTIDDPKLRESLKKTEENIGPLAQCGGFGYAVPQVLLKSEYDWFTTHNKRWGDWLNEACSREYNGKKFDPSEFPIPEVEK